MELLDSLNKGLTIMPVIGLDSEGGDVWFNLGWVGETDMVAMLVGPGFFPREIMEILERNDVY